jgi:hypothetical protein
MRSAPQSRRTRVAACAAVAAVAAGGVAMAAGEPARTAQAPAPAPATDAITACQKKRGAGKGRLRVIRPAARCRRGETRLTWAVAGPAGAPGAPGGAGPKGETGTVDTANFYDKAASDARYLAATGTAADAERLDGLDATDFVAGPGAVRATSGPVDDVSVLDVGGVRMLVTCGPGASAIEFSNLSGSPARWFDQVSVTSGQMGSPGSTVLASLGNGARGQARVQVAWGPSLERATTFTVSIERGGGCPAFWWASAVTVG